MATNPPQQGGGFDLNKLFRPPSPGPAGGGNLATSPSFPAQSSTQPPPPFLTPSSSYPPPTGPYPFHYMPYPPTPVRPPPLPSPTTSGNDLLLAFFGNQNQNQSQSPSGPPVRLLSSKVPKGRHLAGDSIIYDIDVRLPGEVQPQLEVTPITKYGSDPGLVLGRQIAVNRSYICYGLKLGNIRILNINTALRSLLRGHTQRVTDMAFFAEDVHLLASASVDGRIFVWKINEGPDEEDKPQIFGKVVIALQILGHGPSMHPRVCWHPHKQEILIVSIGNRILKIDTIKVGKMEGFSVEEPLNCPIDKLLDGIQFVGKHDGEITELSMCQWLTTRLASASVDGTVKIWEDRKPVPLAVFRPHDGYPVNSATFLTAPHRPDHIIFITGGLLNRELKIWVSATEEGWLLPSDSESWQCTQTLELKSSAETKIEDSFFNQVVGLPRSGLVLLANAKKNAIYALHIDYGPYPAATRMDYIAEFTVTMPILSLTGTSETLPDGEHTVQVYCVQTQAIQQYALDLSQCLPPPLDNIELDKTDSGRVFDVTNADDSVTPGLFNTSKSSELSAGYSTSLTSAISVGFEVTPMPIRMERMSSSEVTTLPEYITSAMDNKPTAVPFHSNSEHIYAPPTVPLSPKLAQKSSCLKSPPNNDKVSNHPPHDYSGDGGSNAAKENKADISPRGDNFQKNDISVVPDPPLVFKPPTHLVTPSEILSTAASTSETVQIGHGGEPKVQNVVVSNGAENVEVEVKVVEEAEFAQTGETECTREPHVIIAEKKEKAFYSQASDLGLQMAGDFRRETYSREGTQQVNDASVAGLSSKLANDGEGEGQDMMKNAPPDNIESDIKTTPSQSPYTATKAKKHRGKNTQIPYSLSPSPYNSTDSNEPACSSGAQSSDAVFPQLQPMQDMLEQLMSMQKEMQKQMNAIVSGPVNKEGKRLEASLGRNLEKVCKSHNDALWSRFLEENAKHEKLERDRTQQITNLITNCMNKDLPAVFEKTWKKEIAAIGPAVARAITPNLEKSISAAISESFQRGVGDKAVNQLEKSVGSKLEATVARQIQSQFQTSGKQALQDALRTSLETSVIPAFEMSCKTMFEQIESTFQKGLMKHTTAAQQQFETAHSSLAVAMRDAINSAASVTQTLSGELAEGQRKILAIAAAGANSKDGNTLVKHLSNGPLAGLHELPEAHLDPMEELSRFLAERKYDEAFTAALHRNDVSIVSWLCSQVDLHAILSIVPVPLTQGVLLALLQQLSCDMSNETSKKVSWMTDVAVAITPSDPQISMHVRPIFDQVYQIAGHLRSLPNVSVSEAANLRVLMHIINAVLRSC